MQPNKLTISQLSAPTLQDSYTDYDRDRMSSVIM